MRKILVQAQRLTRKHPDSIFMHSSSCEVEEKDPTDIALLLKEPGGVIVATLTIFLDCGLPVLTFRVKQKLSPELRSSMCNELGDFLWFASEALKPLTRCTTCGDQPSI